MSKASADIIVAVIATLIGMTCFEAGLLISLAWAAIPFIQGNAP